MKKETIDKANKLLNEISLVKSVEQQLLEIRSLSFRNNSQSSLFQVFLRNKNSSRIDEAFTRATEEFLRRLQDVTKITRLQLQLELDDLKDVDIVSGEPMTEEEL